MDTEDPTALSLFERLEQSSLGNQLADSEELVGELWRGFVFQVGELDLAVPFLGEFEIVPYQELFPLPNSASWIKGMTNIRGEIYTVVDFAEFCGREPVRNLAQANLFLLPDTSLKSALLIGGRISLKSFPFDLPTTGKELFPEQLVPFLDHVVVEDSRGWGVLDVDHLCTSQSFGDASS